MKGLIYAVPFGLVMWGRLHLLHLEAVASRMKRWVDQGLVRSLALIPSALRVSQEERSQSQ